MGLRKRPRRTGAGVVREKKTAAQRYMVGVERNDAKGTRVQLILI